MSIQWFLVTDIEKEKGEKAQSVVLCDVDRELLGASVSFWCPRGHPLKSYVDFV